LDLLVGGGDAQGGKPVHPGGDDEGRDFRGDGTGGNHVSSTVRGALFAGVLAVTLLTAANSHSSTHSSAPARDRSVAAAFEHRFDRSDPSDRLTAARLVRSETGTTPAAAAAPTATTPSPAEPVPAVPTLPPRGAATAFGCGPALEYLAAYAAAGFVVQCPGNAQGHQATTTCISGASRCSMERLIIIEDPCAAAYMNEASNSFVVLGLSSAPIDPYGYCH
jgi:hypothetical protein